MPDATSAESASIETRQDTDQTGGDAKYWQGQIELAEKDHRDWIKDGKSIVKRYKGSVDTMGTRAAQRKFNILYSNTETMKAALFARMAKPDIRRRFADQDKVGRQIAEIIERAAIYTQEADDSEKAMEHAIADYLLPGRGVIRVCYEAETAEGDDKKEYVSQQDLYEEYVSWDDFRHEPAKTWDQVTWEAFRHRMSRDDLKDNFGSEGEDNGSLSEQDIADIPLNWSPDPNDTKVPDAYKRAEVWEIFDKTERQRVWIVKEYNKICRIDDDPFGLEGFFPNAEPLQAVSANDTFIPTPEFNIYKDQADGLDEIEARIDRLTRALKRRGVYDATFKELSRLSKANDNEFVPVKNYAELSTKGGLAAAFQAEDISMLAKVLGELHTQRDLRKQTIYEVVGIADIMRGISDPSETMGAQKIKAHFGGSRLRKRQEKVQKWIRDTLRIKCELIAEHFEPQKLAEMTGFQYIDATKMQALIAQQQMALRPPIPPMQSGIPQGGPPQGMNGQPNGMAQQPMPQTPPPPPMPEIGQIITDDMIKVMRNDKLRAYRIDVETDSTVFEDAEAEKQARTELLKALTEFVVAWSPIISGQPHLMPLAFELLEFGVRGFKAGRSLEDVIEQTRTELENVAKQASQQPPHDPPEVQAEKAKAAADQQKAQQSAQLAQQSFQQKAQLAQQQHQMEMQKMQADLQMQREEMAMVFKKLGMEMLKDQHEAQLDLAARHHQAMLDTRATELAHSQRMEGMENQRPEFEQ